MIFYLKMYSYTITAIKVYNISIIPAPKIFTSPFVASSCA